MKTVKRLTKPRKSKVVYDRLRDMAIAGEFSGRHAWSVRTLAAAFHTSPAPVVEAVRQLEKEGVFLVHPQRGISINRLDRVQFHQAILLREGIEVQAIRLLAIQGDKNIQTALLKKARVLKKMSRRDLGQYYLAYFRFHWDIVQACQCPMLLEAYDKISVLCMISPDLWGYEIEGDPAKKPDTHAQVIEALASGSPDYAEKILRLHIRSLVFAKNQKNQSGKHR